MLGQNFRCIFLGRYKERFSNLLTGFGEFAVFIPQNKEVDCISKHHVFNEIGLADPPTTNRLIRSRSNQK